MSENTIRKILCVHQGYELYGSDRSFLLSINAIKDKYPDAHITALIPHDGPLVECLEEATDTLLIQDLAILRKSVIKHDLLGFIVKLIPAFKRAYHNFRRYDLIYINTIVVLDYILASFFFRKRSILHIREITSGISRSIFSLLIRMSKSLVLFNSEHTQNTYKISHDNRGTVILNGVKGFSNIPPINFTGRDFIHILHLGRFSSLKGQDLLLDAIADLSMSDRKLIKSKIVGSVFADQFYYRDKLVHQIDNLNLGYCVTMLPFEKYPQKLYQWADIVVVSSTKPESFGRVAIEAMSAGRCVIAADHGGLLEIVTHLKDGVFFKKNSSSELKNALSYVINDKKLLVELGQTGRETFMKSFSQECYMKNFKNYLETNFD